MATIDHKLTIVNLSLAVFARRLAVAGHILAVAGHSQDDRTGPSVGSDQIGLQEGVVAFADSSAARMVVLARLSSFVIKCRPIHQVD